MQLFYEGTDITGDVDIVKCVHRDVSGSRCDTMEIELENAAAWYRWNPQKDDRIIASANGYDTGILYLNSVLPEEGKYRILATSIPSAARRIANRSYENARLSDILAACAAECGMESAVFGDLNGIAYAYILRKEESAPAFLNRILNTEGAAFKAINGRMTAIAIDYAQDITPERTITLRTDEAGVSYARMDDRKLTSITLSSPYAEVTATDRDAQSGLSEITTLYQATDNVQAGRWARGLLLMRNRQAEELNIKSELSPCMSALSRIDIESATDTNGEWIIDEAENDLLNGTSRARLLRCIRSIE